MNVWRVSEQETRVNGAAETNNDEKHRNGSDVNSTRHVRPVTPADVSGGIEENALRDATLRSSRSGWTNADRSRLQQHDTTVRFHNNHYHHARLMEKFDVLQTNREV